MSLSPVILFRPATFQNMYVCAYVFIFHVYVNSLWGHELGSRQKENSINTGWSGVDNEVDVHSQVEMWLEGPQHRDRKNTAWHFPTVSSVSAAQWLTKEF